MLCLAHLNPTLCQHTHTNMHTRTHTHTQTLTNSYTNSHTNSHTHTHTHTQTHTHSHSTHTPLSPVCKPLFYLIVNQMWDQKTQADLSACILMPGCGVIDSVSVAGKVYEVYNTCCLLCFSHSWLHKVMLAVTPAALSR